MGVKILILHSPGPLVHIAKPFGLIGSQGFLSPKFMSVFLTKANRLSIL